MIFLVDCSGSMTSAMKAVISTLQILLRSLPETSYFNVFDFGTSCRSMFAESVPYDSESLKFASEHTQTKKADLGGTNLLDPMTQILKSKCQEGYSRQLFILTDGKVRNREECIQSATLHSHDTRIFTFGIGRGVDVELVYGIAEAGNGLCELLEQDSMDEPVMRLLQRALKPAVTALNIEWKGFTKEEAKSSPYHIPPLFSDSSLTVFLNLEKEKLSRLNGILEGELTGKIGNIPFSQIVKIDLNQVAKKKKGEEQLKQLLGKSLIRDLQEGRSFLSQQLFQLLFSLLLLCNLIKINLYNLREWNVSNLSSQFSF
eukprot:TRINITY_DN10400_c0_g1_i1.p1 TRINITY_DN10400_c0_g1~~TRINITY_DN10400_c0_g1_i1.p1  ORF type:complete len:316 (+),score=129.00 TRINITY_DN10400_c0_g1_i1:827-1774(+)